MPQRVGGDFRRTAAGGDEAAWGQDRDLHRRAMVTGGAGLSWRGRCCELDSRGWSRHPGSSWPRDGPGCRSSGASQPGRAGAARGARFVQAGARKRPRRSIVSPQPVRPISGRPTRMFSSPRIRETGKVVIAAGTPLSASATKTSTRPSLIRQALSTRRRTRPVRWCRSQSSPSSGGRGCTSGRSGSRSEPGQREGRPHAASPLALDEPGRDPGGAIRRTCPG